MKRNKQGPRLQVIDGNGQELADQLLLSIFELDDAKRKELSSKLNARAKDKINLAYNAELIDAK